VGRMHGRKGVLLHSTLYGTVLRRMWDIVHWISVRVGRLGWTG